MSDRVIPARMAGTIAGLLRERLARDPDKTAYRYFDTKARLWADLSWRDFASRVGRFQQALETEGFAAGERVAIMLGNGVDWVASDQAAAGLGLITVPIFVRDRADSANYLLAHSGARCLFVPDTETFEALVAAGLPATVRRVVVCNTEFRAKPAGVGVRLADWLPDTGRGLQVQDIDPTSPATIVYTSGTTGRPKGVVLSHHNLLANAFAALESLPLARDDLLLSFLPLSHTLEHTCGYLGPLMAGVPVAFARSVEQLLEDLRQVNPTMLIAVPRIFERVYFGMQEKLAARPAWVGALLRFTIRAGWNWFEYRQGRGPLPVAAAVLPLLRPVFARPVLEVFGQRLRAAVCGGAPLSPEVARTFLGLGLSLLQGYGLTEASPVVSANSPRDNDPASVGRPIRDTEVRIASNGEVLVRGPGVMRGYWNDVAATREAIDDQGWLHTGDLGELRGQRLYLTGRSKEIIVMSTGEKVPPADIEHAILDDRLVDQAMLIGEGKPYLSILVVLNRQALAGLLQELGLAADAETALTKEPVKDAVLARVANRMREFPGYAQVHRVGLLLEPWSIDNGLLTSSLKIRRPQVAARFAELIADLYAGHKSTTL